MAWHRVIALAPSTGAFDRAADAVEIDVALTGNDTPMLMRAPTVDRTTNATGVVRNLAAEVRALDACSKRARWAPCPVPTLGEALEVARRRGMLAINVNGDYSPVVLPALASPAPAAGMHDIVLGTCFDRGLLRDRRAIDPVLALGQLMFTVPSPDVAALGHAVLTPEQRAVRTPAAAVRQSSSYAAVRGIRAIPSADTVRALVGPALRQLMSDVPLERAALT